jgi:hypothetical protein
MYNLGRCLDALSFIGLCWVSTIFLCQCMHLLFVTVHVSTFCGSACIFFLSIMFAVLAVIAYIEHVQKWLDLVATMNIT